MALVVAGGGRHGVVLHVACNGVLQGVPKEELWCPCGDVGSHGMMLVSVALCREKQGVESEGVCAP